MSKTKKSSSSLSSKAKKFSRAGLAVLSSIPTPGWGSASKKALAVSVSRSKVKKTNTKNKNQTNKKTSKRLSSLKKMLELLKQKSRYGRMYTNARKLSSEWKLKDRVQKLKMMMLPSTVFVPKRPTNEKKTTEDVYAYFRENKGKFSHLEVTRNDIDYTTGTYRLPYGYNRSRSESNQGFKKSINSIGEIFVDIWDADKMRRENRYNSVYDYLNYKSGGVLEGTRLAFDGGAERSKKMFDSPYGFGNWLTNGSFDLVGGAFNPEDPLSKEHWLSSFGLAGMVAGGGAAAQALRVGRNTKPGTSSGATKEKKPENTQEVNGSKGTGEIGKVKVEDVVFSDKFNKGKFKNQVAARGWTNEKIADAINNPVKVGESVNKATGNKAKLYFVDDVHYVAVDVGTGKVIQVADLNKVDWVPEDGL